MEDGRWKFERIYQLYLRCRFHAIDYHFLEQFPHHEIPLIDFFDLDDAYRPSTTFDES
ncbi:MAG: hypothetical protein RL750_290 [Bacteroidota bacterium]